MSEPDCFADFPLKLEQKLAKNSAIKQNVNDFYSDHGKALIFEPFVYFTGKHFFNIEFLGVRLDSLIAI